MLFSFLCCSSWIFGINEEEMTKFSIANFTTLLRPTKISFKSTLKQWVRETFLVEIQTLFIRIYLILSREIGRRWQQHKKRRIYSEIKKRVFSLYTVPHVSWVENIVNRSAKQNWKKKVFSLIVCARLNVLCIPSVWRNMTQFAKYFCHFR